MHFLQEDGALLVEPARGNQITSLLSFFAVKYIMQTWSLLRSTAGTALVPCGQSLFSHGWVTVRCQLHCQCAGSAGIPQSQPAAHQWRLPCFNAQHQAPSKQQHGLSAQPDTDTHDHAQRNSTCVQLCPQVIRHNCCTSTVPMWLNSYHQLPQQVALQCNGAPQSKVQVLGAWCKLSLATQSGCRKDLRSGRRLCSQTLWYNVHSKALH